MSITLNSQLASLNNNRIHRYATLWQIGRVDGTYLRFTDHNTDLNYQGYLFKSAIGFQVSATQREAGLSEQNKEAMGMTIPEGVASGITFEDMRGGKYRNAKVKEWLVDWQYPWVGAVYETEYLLSDIAFDEHKWRGELIGQAKYLRMPVGKVYNRNCRHRFGSSHHYKDGNNVQLYEPRCGFDLAGNVNFSSEGGGSALPARLSGLTIDAVPAARNTFSIAINGGSGGYPANAWQYGIATFQTTSGADKGLNAGLSFEIATSTEGDSGNNTPSEIRLFVDAPYDIQVGDKVQVMVGCAKTMTHCKNRFNNFANFGGFPHIPGADRAILIPDTK